MKSKTLMFVLTVQHKELWSIKCCTCHLLTWEPNLPIQGKNVMFDSEERVDIYWSSNLFELMSSLIQNLPLFMQKHLELWFKNITFCNCKYFGIGHRNFKHIMWLNFFFICTSRWYCKMYCSLRGMCSILVYLRIRM